MARQKNNAAEGNAIPQLARDVRKALSPGRGTVCRVDRSTAAEVIRYAASICLQAKEKADGKTQPKIETWFDKANTPEGIVALLESQAEADGKILASEPKLRAAVQMLGTHGGKIPDARLGLGAMVPDRSVTMVTASILGMHSDSVESSHPMSGAGNAALNSFIRFLCLGISYEGGPPKPLAAFLAEPCAARDAFLSEVGEDSRASLLRIGADCAARLDSADGIPDNVSAYRSQVLFPVKGGYVSLSPLYSYSVGAELAARIQLRCWGEDVSRRERLDVRVAHVGGTKPQNTGLLATYTGGRFPRLVGMPPREFSFEARAAVREFRGKGLAVAGGVVAAESLLACVSAYYAHDMRPNARTRDLLSKAIGSICGDVLGGLDVIARENDIALATTESSLTDEKSVPARSRDIALLLGMLEDDPTSDDLDRIAAEVAFKVGRKLQGRTVATMSGKRKLSVDERLHDQIAEIARLQIEEYV